MEPADSVPQRDLIDSRVEDLDTPALVLDWPACQRNLRRMAAFFDGRTCRLRPHFKNHKCPELARRQLEAGNCAGFTCAKLGEAEVLAARGFNNLLVANQVVGPRKIARLVQLARQIHIQVAVDDAEQARAISQAASAAGVTVGVLIEIDIGMGRCGLAPGQPVLDLAAALRQMPGIRFEGLQAYEGQAVYTNDFERRAELVRAAMAQAVDTRRLLEDHGLAVARSAAARRRPTGSPARSKEWTRSRPARIRRWTGVTPRWCPSLRLRCRCWSGSSASGRA